MLIGAERLCGYPFDGEWQDMGTPERLVATEMKLRDGGLRPHYL